MLSSIASKLIQGEFICQYTNFAMFNEINKPDGEIKNKLEEFLLVVGRTLECSQSGNAFFAAHKKDAPGAKEESRRIFDKLRSKIRPTLSFLQLMAEINHTNGETGVFIQGGEILVVPEIIGALEKNQAHLSALDRLVWVKRKDEPLTQKVKSLFKELEKEGLVVIKNASLEHYVVTGKTDVIQDSMAFIADAENIYTEDQVEAKQRGLDL